MANNITQLKADLKTSFTNNLDATTRTKLLARFVSAYNPEWTLLVAGGTVDNASNRADFAVKKVFDFIQEIYRGESYKENVAAIPAPETIA